MASLRPLQTEADAQAETSAQLKVRQALEQAQRAALLGKASTEAPATVPASDTTTPMEAVATISPADEPAQQERQRAAAVAAAAARRALLGDAAAAGGDTAGPADLESAKALLLEYQKKEQKLLSEMQNLAGHLHTNADKLRSLLLHDNQVTR